jgi:tRNA C32,U32 (ribose-2'-O)-methylase TrmJ
MGEAKIPNERRPHPSSDLAVVVAALEEALTIIDDHAPDRNPTRCMRQLRRLLNNSHLRSVVKRLGRQ